MAGKIEVSLHLGVVDYFSPQDALGLTAHEAEFEMKSQRGNTIEIE